MSARDLAVYTVARESIRTLVAIFYEGISYVYYTKRFEISLNLSIVIVPIKFQINVKIYIEITKCLAQILINGTNFFLDFISPIMLMNVSNCICSLAISVQILS